MSKRLNRIRLGESILPLLVLAVSTLEEQNLGRIAQIIGPVLDVVFPPGKMPNIYNALVVKGRDTIGQQINVTCEVQQLLGNNRVRAVAMSATDGLMRGMEVIDTGAPLSVPVGGATLGRIFNVLGEPTCTCLYTVRDELAIFETGIKVVDLLLLIAVEEKSDYLEELE
ncbi:hypothetical protein C4D60_Mb00t11990 [Musa balbisiana]|uniref:H(+)-transporting two-sector ATPase n=1 Tax=Musa balbisiana TaxID=52838 RepID=A0A4S8I372_MUSBA|nr:hypothetical protein C4D60_Mb00t11990 [Musa balbisiana]